VAKHGRYGVVFFGVLTAMQSIMALFVESLIVLNRDLSFFNNIGSKQ